MICQKQCKSALCPAVEEKWKKMPKNLLDWKIMRTFAAELKQKRTQAWSDWQQMHGGGATQDSKSREKWAMCVLLRWNTREARRSCDGPLKV